MFLQRQTGKPLEHLSTNWKIRCFGPMCVPASPRLSIMLQYGVSVRVAPRQSHYCDGRLIARKRLVDDASDLIATHRGPSCAKFMNTSDFISTARSGLVRTMLLGMSTQFLKRQPNPMNPPRRSAVPSLRSARVIGKPYNAGSTQ